MPFRYPSVPCSFRAVYTPELGIGIRLGNGLRFYAAYSLRARAVGSHNEIALRKVDGAAGLDWKKRRKSGYFIGTRTSGIGMDRSTKLR